MSNTIEILNTKGLVLIGRKYHESVLDAIVKSTESIYVSIFYISYDPAKKESMVNTMVEELVNAHNRGVAIKVFLDIDKEGEVYNSKTINEKTFEYLKSNGIDVEYDNPEKLSHGKVVVIDKVHNFIGSHNWTLNSFFVYNDTSLHIESTELADYYVETLFAQ